MSTKTEHLKFIHDNGKFTVDCFHGIFSTEELEILQKYGHWFRALTSGKLSPITNLQREFVAVFKGEREPFTIEELAWFKYLGRKKVEARYGDKLNDQYHPYEDTFYNRTMVKQQRSLQCRIMKEIHKS